MFAFGRIGSDVMKMQDAMKMVGHDSPYVQFDIRAMRWSVQPFVMSNLPDIGKYYFLASDVPEEAFAVSCADRDEIAAPKIGPLFESRRFNAISAESSHPPSMPRGRDAPRRVSTPSRKFTAPTGRWRP